MRVRAQHLEREVEPLEGEVQKALVDPPHRVEDAHRALHDVGHVLPANRVQLPFGSGEGIDLAVAKTAGDRAPDDPQGRADGAGEGQEETNGSTV